MSVLRLSLFVSCLLAVSLLVGAQTPPTCSSSLSAVNVPSPYYELSFTNNPTTAGVSQFQYLSVDSSDSGANQGFHKGLILLAGSSNVSYINMSATSGSPYYGGATLPQPIGGQSAGRLQSGTYGWSFEVVFKATAQVTWAKIFDIGNDNNNGCHDDILLGWNSNTLGFQADYCSSGTSATPNVAVGGGSEQPIYPVYQVVLGQWTHAVLVFQALLTPQGNASVAANYLLYINGQMAPTQGYGGPYPTAVYRKNPTLGRSDWGDRWWQGLIDDFSIYNYALQYDQAQALYQYRMGGCQLQVGASSTSYPAAPSQATGAVTPKQVVFSSNDPTSICGASCAYGFLASDPDDATCGLSSTHTGLLNLYGSQNPTTYQPYINLTATSGPNAISTTPVIQVGGASSGNLAQGTYGWSFELMFKPHIVETWAKLMDLSAPQTNDSHCHHDIITGWVSDGPTMSFSTCDYDNYQYSIPVIANTPIYTWIHLVIVIQQDPSNSNSSIYYSYVNGQLTNNAAAQWYPAGVYRQNGFLARSEWAPDYFWNGLLDTYNIYDVAISAPQAIALWNSVSNNGQAATSCVNPNSGNTATTIDPSWRVFEAAFTTDPRSSTGNAATAGYGWLASDTTDSTTQQAQHSGLVTFAGAAANSTTGAFGQYVNLSATGGPYYIGQTLPQLLIGAITPGTSPLNATTGWAFEVVFKATGQWPWSKVFDIGNYQPNNDQYCLQDIVFGWNGNNANQMGFQICDQFNSGQGPLPAFTTNILNTWHHMIANVVLQTNGLAVYQVWLDGAIQSSSAFTTWIWPQYVQRTNALLGRSNWNDPYWQGYIDYFAIYNRALDSSQIQNQYYQNMLSQQPAAAAITCTQTSTSVPAPWYALTFSSSPLVAAGISTATYSWLSGSDVIDQDNGQSKYHTGLLVLPGGPSSPVSGPYVNLSAPTGTPQSIGTPLPGPIGGNTNNGGDITKGTYGWSFEVTFKPTSQQTWAKLFDIGNPQVNGVCRDDLLFGWISTTQTWSFTYCDGTGFQYTANPWFQVTLGQWYHVVISIQRLIDSDGTMSNAANYYMYINGQQLAGSGAGGPYPNAINRANADLGRSDWSDNYYGGEIDTFRIYNSALTLTQAQALYQNANGGCQLSVGSSTSNSAQLEWLTPSRDTGSIPQPKFSMSGNSDPRTQSGMQYAYNWTQYDAYDQTCGVSQYRSGLYVMPGLDQQFNTNGPFINLSQATGPNSIGQVLPNIGGQSSGTQSTIGGGATGTAGWSFEYMVKPALVETWAKLFDLGQPQTPDGACHDDIISGWFSDGPYWSFSTCDPQNTQYAINNALGVVYLDTWVHAVMVIQQSPSNASWANYFSYVNGHLYGAYSTSWYPRSVYRANSLIARSDWSSDYYWSGEIDFFNIYDVAITGPQALQLYNAATNNGAAKSCTVYQDYTATLQPSWLIYQELFTDDPRLRAGAPGIAGANYSWTNNDATDSTSTQQYHQGLLTLGGGPGGSYSQWVNLSATSGPASIANKLDTSFIGGLGSGYALAKTAGFSIEIVFKPTAQQTWGKLIDFGPLTGTCYYDIVFGWQASSATAMTWSACDQFNTEWPTVYNNRVATSSIQVGQWYHVVLIVAEVPGGGSGEYMVYQNGVLTMDQIDSYYPQNFIRPNAALGRSDWGDAFWEGEIDSIRIYNRALNQWQVGTLYTQATGQPSPAGSPPKICNGVPCTSSSGLSGGAIAGIVIGSVVGAAILLVVLFMMCCVGSRGGKKSSTRTDESSNTGTGKFGEIEPSRSGVEMSGVQGETDTDRH